MFAHLRQDAIAGAVLGVEGVAQWPYILPTTLKGSAAAASDPTLETIVVVFVVAAVVILASSVPKAESDTDEADHERDRHKSKEGEDRDPVDGGSFLPGVDETSARCRRLDLVDNPEVPEPAVRHARDSTQTEGDFERAQGWCAGAWDLIEDGRLEFVDEDAP